jgi:hypothetical protein
MRRMNPEFATVILFATGVLFALSGWSKLKDLGRFSQGLELYGVLPHSFVGPASILIPVLEVVIAATFLLNCAIYVAAPTAALLTLSFIVAIVSVLRRGEAVSCLCFGATSSENVSTRTLVRAVLLLVGTAVVAYMSIRQTSPFIGVYSRRGLLVLLCAIVLLEALAWCVTAPDLLALTGSCKRCAARFTGRFQSTN